MWSRLDLSPLFRGHWKGLTNTDGSRIVGPDWVARLALLLPAMTLGTIAGWQGWTLQAGASLLAGVALLVGSSLTAFTHISTLRSRLTDRPDDPGVSLDRDAYDESAAHMLMAVLVAIVDAVAIVIGLNTTTVGSTAVTQAPTPSPSPSPAVTHATTPLAAGSIGGIAAAIVIGLSTYLVLLFLMLLPRLYNAYVVAHRVRRELSGFHRSQHPVRRVPPAA